MKTVDLKCPNCGASVDYDEGMTKVFCRYCGTPVIIDDESVRINVTNRIVDEARVRELDLEAQKLEYHRSEMAEYKEKEAEWKKIAIGWLAAVGVSFFLLMMVANVRFLGALSAALTGVLMLFGGAGVWMLKPKKDRMYTPNQGIQPDGQYNREVWYSDKNRFIAFVLCLFFGYFGAHQFYVGNYRKGLLYLFTVGLFYCGWIADIFRIANGSFTDGEGKTLR